MKNFGKLILLWMSHIVFLFLIFIDKFPGYLGKIYSWVLPIGILLLAISISCGVVLSPEWGERLFCLVIAIFFLLTGIYLLVKRKDLGWY